MVSYKSKPRQPLSAAQLAERQRTSSAAAAWRGLAPGVRSEWQALGVQFGRNPWIIFHQEWLVQRVAPPALPLIPTYN
jgi:hypothetical protein